MPRAEPIDSTLRQPNAPPLGTALDGSSIPASRTRAPGEQVGAPRGGAADVGSRRGDDGAAPAAQPASAPRLNLELARPRSGDIARQPSSGVLQLLPPPPARKSKLAEDIENAAKADCRKAHSGLGLLAVVPLAIDAVKEAGCRW